MYDYIKGTYISKNESGSATMTVECGGIGYLLNVTGRTLSAFNLKDEVKVYVTLIHKEDSMSLCGFAAKEDRDIFNILQSVSGVGMKSSLVLLNEFTGCELINAVINEDYSLMSRAKGIGPKLAKKIIIELKDKLINLQNKAPIILEAQRPANIEESFLQETQAVLLSLGYTQDEIKKSVNHSLKNHECKTAEDVLKFSLQYLSSNY